MIIMQPRFVLAALVVVLAACLGGPRRAPVLSAVPVEGAARDLRMLAGSWQGEFVSARGSRRGVIAFSLDGGRDTAYGRVVLAGPTPPPGCADPVSQATTSPVVGEIVLTLASVNVGGLSVGGWLRPYRDPELGCLMDTWFEGTIEGDRLDGLYFSHPADTAGAMLLGTWWAARQR
jgi:hypothetical protein